MKKTFWSLLHTCLWNSPFWKLKKAKNLKFITTHQYFSHLSDFFGGGCLGHTAEKGMMWLWRDFLKRYFPELIQLKYKLILWIKTMGCCGLACVVWLKSCEFSKRKSVLIVGKSSMMCLLQKFFNLTYMWTFWKWVNLFGIFTSCEELRAFERNQSLWSSYLMPWTPIV